MNRNLKGVCLAALCLAAVPAQAVKIFEGSADYGLKGFDRFFGGVDWRLSVDDDFNLVQLLSFSAFDEFGTNNTWDDTQVTSIVLEDNGSLLTFWEFEVECPVASQGSGVFFGSDEYTSGFPCAEDRTESATNVSTTLVDDGAQVPEPATMALLGAGFLGLLGLRRRRA